MSRTFDAAGFLAQSNSADASDSLEFAANSDQSDDSKTMGEPQCAITPSRGPGAAEATSDCRRDR